MLIDESRRYSSIAFFLNILCALSIADEIFLIDISSIVLNTSNVDLRLNSEKIYSLSLCLMINLQPKKSFIINGISDMSEKLSVRLLSLFLVTRIASLVI